MDPVTAVGLAGTIISVMQVTGALLVLTQGYIGGVRSASKDIEKLQKSLKDLTQLLEDLGNHAKKNPGLESLTKLNSEDGPLKQCSRELESLHSKLDQPGKNQLLRSLKWPMKAGEVTQFCTQIEGYKSLFNLALNLDHLSLSQDTSLAVKSEAAEQALWRQNEATRRQKKDAFRAGRNDPLSWLYPEPTDTKHLEISNARQQGTGDWFLRSPEFRGFNKEGSGVSFLWAHGIPGAGKTFISSLAIDYLKGQASTGCGVAYIYFDYKDQHQHQPTLILASLAKQLACLGPQIPPKIQELQEILEKEIRKATFEELYTAFIATQASFSRAYLIFDALDECKPNDRRKLLKLFKRMEKDGFSIFLTSRPFPEDIQLSLADVAKIEISANEEDIRSYINAELDEHPQAKILFQRAQCNDIAADLMACTQGIFLLVHFYIEDLCQQTSSARILAALDALKKSTIKQGSGPLDFIYERAVKSIIEQHDDRKSLALKVLSWLVKAKRTLTFQELQVAVSVTYQRYKLDALDLPDRETILDVCASLVIIDENTKTVRLVHQTAQEYLLEHSILLGNAGFNVFMACATYLSFEVFAKGACTTFEAYGSQMRLYPFLEYAAYHLPFHIRDCKEHLSTDIVMNLLERPGNSDHLWQILTFKDLGPDDRAMYDYGLPIKTTPLHLASSIGHYTIVGLLLEKGADLFAIDGGQRTALHFAAKEGHVEIVRLLAEKGAVKQDILHKARRKGRLAVDRLLGRKGTMKTDIEHSAAGKGRQTVARTLTGKEAIISTKDSDGRTALHLAAVKGSEAVVQLLIEKGANISVKDNNKHTALHLAAVKGREAVVQLLVEKGADVLDRNIYKEAVLHLAIFGGNEAVVQLLIEKGADISVKEANGQTPLHLAARWGHEAVAKLLIEKGADTSATDRRGRVAFHLAARWGHGAVVRLLAEKGADITLKDNRGRTILHDAARGGDEAMVQLLIKKGADMSVKNMDQQTALHEAVNGKREAVVRLLVEKGADITAKERNEQTVLSKASKWGNLAVVQLLIDNGADIFDKNKSGRTALYSATVGGNAAVVQLLIEKGADISLEDNYRQTVLHEAVCLGHEAVVQILIEKGADVSAKEVHGLTPLHIAAMGGYVAVALLLIENGADISVEDGDGKTALQLAMEMGYEAVVQLLTEKGADNLVSPLPSS